MELDAAKMVGAGLATIALFGVGIGIGNVFSTLISTVGRNPSVQQRVFPFAIIGGDLNSRAAGESLPLLGYSWPTSDGPRTTLGGRWDHVFVKGLRADTTGTVDDRGASDHRAIWARVVARN